MRAFRNNSLIRFLFTIELGAVYEHRWLSQSIFVRNRVIWPRFPTTRSNWHNGDFDWRTQVMNLHRSICPFKSKSIYDILTHRFLFFCREKLCGHLPARAEGYSWSLVFSTSQNGFSLNSLYRKLARIESPILIVIQDTENNVSITVNWNCNIELM